MTDYLLPKSSGVVPPTPAKEWASRRFSVTVQCTECGGSAMPLSATALHQAFAKAVENY